MNSLSVYQYLVNIGIISKHSYFPHKNLSIVKCYLRALLCFLYMLLIYIHFLKFQCKGKKGIPKHKEKTYIVNLFCD